MVCHRIISAEPLLSLASGVKNSGTSGISIFRSNCRLSPQLYSISDRALDTVSSCSQWSDFRRTYLTNHRLAMTAGTFPELRIKRITSCAVNQARGFQIAMTTLYCRGRQDPVIEQRHIDQHLHSGGGCTA